MKKLFFLFALAFFASCNISEITEGVNFSFSPPQSKLFFDVPSAAKGTTTIIRSIAITSIDSQLRSQTRQLGSEVGLSSIQNYRVVSGTLKAETGNFSSLRAAKLSVEVGNVTSVLLDTTFTSNVLTDSIVLTRFVDNNLASRLQGNTNVNYIATFTTSAATAAMRVSLRPNTQLTVRINP
jgi:hypothetical protein